MKDCTSLRVIGDPVFGRNVRCVGEVLIDGYKRVRDDAVLGEPAQPAPAPRSTLGRHAHRRRAPQGDPHDARAGPDRVDAAHREPRPRRRPGRACQGQPPGLRQLLDGRVCRRAPTRSPGAGAAPVRLRIVGEVAAGDDPTFPVGPGEAARIMTGAPMPEGADAVIAVEDTDGAADGRGRVPRRRLGAGATSGRRARTSPRGRSSSPAGDIVGPRTIALLAAVRARRRSRCTAGRTSSCSRPATSSSSPGRRCGPARSTTRTPRCSGRPPWSRRVGRDPRGRRRHRRGAARRARRGRRRGRRHHHQRRCLDGRLRRRQERPAQRGHRLRQGRDAARQAAGLRPARRPRGPAGAALRPARQPGVVLRLVRGLRAPGAAPAHAARAGEAPAARQPRSSRGSRPRGAASVRPGRGVALARGHAARRRRSPGRGRTSSPTSPGRTASSSCPRTSPSSSPASSSTSSSSTGRREMAERRAGPAAAAGCRGRAAPDVLG